MNNGSSPILYGIIAGLLAAILMAASGYVPVLSVLLLSLSLAAIFVAGLGAGLLASLTAIIVASAANTALYSSLPSFFFTAIPLLPAAAMAYLANLARPASEIGGPDTAMAWFPLSDILLVGAVLTAIATILTLSLHPNMEELFDAIAKAAIQMAQEMSPEFPVGDETTAQMKLVLQSLWPLVQSLQMLIALFFGYYIANRILAASRRNTRPREDMPTSLRMNRLAILIFFGGIVLMFGGGMIALIGASFTGAVAGGFLLSGFAIIHSLVRGKAWSLPVLVLIYALTLMVPLIGIAIILAGGLANPRRTIALTPQKPNPSNQP